MNINDDAKLLVNALCMGKETSAIMKMKLFNEIKEALQDGTTKSDIADKISSYRQNHPSEPVPPSLKIIMKEQTQTKDEQNLIEPGVFYFHPRLQITPGMPVISFDILKGVIESNYSEFYLEIVDKFTIEDLMQYALSKVQVVDRMAASNIGALKYLLGKYDMKPPYNNLDLVLYMIDTASDLMKDLDMPPMAKLLRLDDFVQEGMKTYQSAYNTKKLSGMDKVIAKK